MTTAATATKLETLEALRRRLDEVIVRHMGWSGEPADDPEGHLLERATTIDVSGGGLDLIPPPLRADVLGRWPRLTFAAEFADPARLAALGSSRFIRFGATRGLAIRKPVADRLVQAARDALPTADAAVARAVLAALARTGQEAARILAADEGIDLVLLDMHLPDGHGLGLLQRIRAAGHLCDVIAVTSARDSDVVRRAVSQGVVLYLLKPFTFAAFRGKLE